MRTAWIVTAIAGLGILAATGWKLSSAPDVLSAEALGQRYAQPLTPPDGPLSVFHLGHSLVGRDMPFMLAQLAEHDFASQLGWGTPLRAHWDPDETIQGFDVENAHPNYRDAKSALSSGAYDVFVLTEMVEIEAAISYFEAPVYLEKWARAAREGNPEIRTYLYESWHALDDPNGWLERLDTDPARHWEGVLLAQAMAQLDAEQIIYVIPAGRVFAALVRKIEAGEGIDGIEDRTDFFARNVDGSLDTIHVNDLGAYLVALTHFAVLYHRSPVGLPYELDRADGTPAVAPGPALARLMQETAWEVVTSLPVTGVARP